MKKKKLFTQKNCRLEIVHEKKASVSIALKSSRDTSKL